MIKEKIIERGFSFSEEDNEYKKKNWVIRILKDTLEAFNNPEIEPGIYYSALLSKIDLDTLLDEIDDKINNSIEND